MSTPPDRLYDMFFDAATKLYDLPENLLRMVAKFESNFNPKAISPEGAVGLMQIVPELHPDVDPTDPYASIDYAADLLRDHYNQFGSWELALAAYNAGPGNVQKYGGIPPFEETQDYVRNILGSLGNVPDRPMEEDIFSRMWNEGESGGSDVRTSPYHHRMPEEGGATYIRRTPDLGDLPYIGKYLVEASERISGPLNRAKYVPRTEPIGDPGPLMWLAPSRVGVSAVSGIARIARKLSPFRKSGVRLAREVSKVSESIGAGGADVKKFDSLTELALKAGGKSADDAAKAVFDEGYSFWTKGLGGKNPSEVARYVNSLTESDRIISQRGQLLSLQENLSNMERLTREAQLNLLSPAGQARLMETFRGMPPEYLTHFNKLVETGEKQRATRFVFLAGIAFQVARKYGREFLEYIGLGSR